MKYYRVAIKMDSSPVWKWSSTVLSSLDAVFRFLRMYSSVSFDRLRVFSSSQKDMKALLANENNGVESNSVSAEQFLQERGIAMIGRGSTRRAQENENEGRGSIAVITRPLLSEESAFAQAGYERCLSSLDRRRLEVEQGAGGDHDLPFTFALPVFMPEVLAWTKLLAKVYAGELEP